jgi:hypothetical protein
MNSRGAGCHPAGDCQSPLNQENTRTWVASFQNRNLRTWETNSGYPWNVTNSVTGEIIAQGEALSREDALIEAAQAAGADWGSAKWRSLSQDNSEGNED